MIFNINKTRDDIAMPLDLETFHKRKQSFENPLKRELLREIDFIADVRSGRAQPRQKVGEKLIRGFTKLIPKLVGDFSGVAIEIGDFVLNQAINHHVTKRYAAKNLPIKTLTIDRLYYTKCSGLNIATAYLNI
jgi:hypothetical protein